MNGLVRPQPERCDEFLLFVFHFAYIRVPLCEGGRNDSTMSASMQNMEEAANIATEFMYSQFFDIFTQCVLKMFIPQVLTTSPMKWPICCKKSR